MTFFNQIFLSFRAYAEAFRFLHTNRLWSFVIVPGLISMLVAGVAGYAAYLVADNMGAYLMHWYPWEIGKSIIEKIANVASGILLFLLFLIVYKNLIIVLVSPFMSPLSVKVEKNETGILQKAALSEVALLWRGLRVALRNISWELLYTLLLLPLSLIPVIGLFFTLLLFVIQAYYAGVGNMDYTLERYFNVRESTGFSKSNKGMAIGNGVVFLSMVLFLPVIGLFLAPPLATIASTMNVIRVLKIKNPTSSL